MTVDTSPETEPRRLSARQSRLVRAAAVILGTLMIAVVAIGPNNALAIFTPKQVPAGPPLDMGFTAQPLPLHVQAKGGAISGLKKVDIKQIIRLSDGSQSPELVYLRLNEVKLDQLAITQIRGENSFILTNSGSGATGAVIGGPTATAELWVTVTGLDICLTPDTIYQVILNYQGVLAGRLDEVLRLFADGFGPFANGEFADVGPCLPLKKILPLLKVLVDAGIPLPSTLPVANLDLLAYSIKITAPNGASAVSLPQGLLQVVQ